MASGKLASADLAAATNVLVYTTTKVSTVNVRVCNRGNSLVKVRLAMGSGSSPALADYISYDIAVPSGGVLEEIGVVMSAAENLWVYASAVGVSVRVHGLEG